MASEETDASSTILTMSELIDNAFGDPDVNTVHHKHIQTILYILARQLRILQRRVSIKLTPYQAEVQKSSSSLSVTEVKLQAMTDTKGSKTSVFSKKGKTQGQHTRKQGSKGDVTSIGPTGKTTSTSDDASTVKASSGKASSYGASTDKASTGKYHIGKTSTTDKSSSTDKSSATGKSSTYGKTRTADDDLSTVDKTTRTSKKTTTDSTAEDTSGDDMTSTLSDKKTRAGKKATAGKTSAADETSTVDKASSAGKKTSAGKTSTLDETSTADKTASAGKTSAAEETSTTDKSSRVKTSAGKASTADDTATVSKKSTTGKTSDRTSSITGTSPLSGRKLSVDKSGKRITAQGRRASADTISIDPQDYQRLLDDVEETRERELRVIHQRADSREESEKTPTPIASLDSLEATYEKLLVVERIPAEEAQARAARGRSITRGELEPRLSVVTQEQFKELAYAVHHLQKKLAPIGTPAFLENAELMQELRKGASLTDAMAALQLSARLEATEKTLTNLLSVVTDLASQTPGYEPTEGFADDIQVLFGASEEKGKQETATFKRKSSKTAKSDKSLTGRAQKESHTSTVPPVQSVVPTMPPELLDTPETGVRKVSEIITYEELETQLQLLHDNIMKQVTEKATQSTFSADNTMKLVLNLEKRIDASLNFGNKMEVLETLFTNYSEQINSLDTGLSSQLTNFQEELTQMQHDLETGLETMAEVLANTGGDATAVAELNGHFSDLQMDIDDAVQRQKELKSIQTNLSMDLDGLRAEIEMLRDTKSDRDEVADALRDKAGLGDLNGLISHQQYDAVRGDIEKRISSAYDKFNSQEAVWQRAIDDLLRELHEKADIVQVQGLRDEINYYLEDLRKKMKFITDIVGEPAAAALSRQVTRDSACLSCASPAFMKTEQSTIPVLPSMRPPAIGAEAPKPKEDGDHGLCYQGYPVNHPVDPRAHICNRWCGGSHTLINVPKSRMPPSVTITPFNRKVGQERGTDGKMYAVDEQVPRKPCSQCIVPDPPTATTHDPKQSDEGTSNVNSFEFFPFSSAFAGKSTPPMGESEDYF